MPKKLRYSANFNFRPGERARVIVIIVFDGCQILDVTGPWEVFAQAATRPPANNQQPAYKLMLSSPNGGAISASSGIRLTGTVPLSSLRGPIDTVLIAGGERVAIESFIRNSSVIAWLRRRGARRFRRIGSVCTGAFVLAAAGLLDGRRATTHWESSGRLARAYPAVTVEDDAIFIADPPIYTSAGVSAGIDLALALVESDLGQTTALAVARELVLFLRRPGGQSQFSAGLEAQARATDRMKTLITWMIEHPEADLSLVALAARAAMSERNLARVFRAETGQTVARFAAAVRVERAKGYLENRRWSLPRVAERCGFGSVDSLARALRQRLGITPGEYRERFSTPGARWP
jgi:transcriptional regulator GlxA family with amidase domain